MAFKFVKGSDVTITIQMIDKATKLPYQLSDFTAATGYLPKDDNSTYLAVSGSLESEDLGKLKFVINETDSAGLLAGDAIDMQVDVDQSTKRTIFVLEGKLQVLDQII